MARRRRGSIEHESAQRLELPGVLERVAGYATSPPGRAAVCAATPSRDPETIRARLEEVAEIDGRIEARYSFQLASLADLRPILTPEDSPSRAFTLRELADVRHLLDRVRALVAAFSVRTDTPRLTARVAELRDLPELRERLELSVDPRGEELLSTASDELDRIRREIDRKERSIREWMERRRNSAELRGVLQGNVISIRNDRFVFAVRVEHRHKVRGVVHGESASGSTLFVEPHEIFRDGSELESLRVAERREISRIVVELTREIRAQREPLERAGESLIELDSLLARARFGRAFGARPVALVDERRLRLVEARHPLLMWREGVDESVPNRDDPTLDLEDVAQKVCPLDIELGRGKYQMVITGPNTGGKTVALKVAGLAALMTYCAIPFPCGEGTEVPLFDGVFADIGDEQSLEQNLSTFSSHMTVTADILRSVSSRSLVLIDELGAGTDPLEGAALGEAILEQLYVRGAFSLVTTHIGRLKEFAFRKKKCQNASMEFDPVKLAPTYRLLVGVPGRSNATFIARGIGVPDEVVDHAERVLAGEERVDQELLEGLERTRRDLDRKKGEMEKHRRSARDLERAAEEELGEVKSLRVAWEHEAERAEEERVRSLVEELRSRLRARGAPPRDRQEAFQRLHDALDAAEGGTTLGARRRELARSLRKGDMVFVPRFQQVCEVKTINKTKEILTVSLSGISTEVPFLDISWILPPPGYEAEWYQGS